jgi:hypothetical protein
MSLSIYLAHTQTIYVDQGAGSGAPSIPGAGEQRVARYNIYNNLHDVDEKGKGGFSHKYKATGNAGVEKEEDV